MKRGFNFRAEREEGISLLRLDGEITAESEEKFKVMFLPEEDAGAVA